MEGRPRTADDFGAIRARMEELKQERGRRPRAADDFAAIRARMEEIKQERERATRNGREERLDESRWRVSDELRRRIGPRRYGPI